MSQVTALSGLMERRYSKKTGRVRRSVRLWYDPAIMTTKLLLVVLLVAPVCFAEDSDQLLTIDHYVRVKSTVPSIAGQITQIYVRERAKAATPLRSANLADRVVLFVHG